MLDRPWLRGGVAWGVAESGKEAMERVAVDWGEFGGKLGEKLEKFEEFVEFCKSCAENVLDELEMPGNRLE